jgi:hypothetical protein
MSGKKSLIIVGIIIAVLIACVYYFSTPGGPHPVSVHMAGDIPSDSAPHRTDTGAVH